MCIRDSFRHARPGYFQIDGDELRKITPNPGYTQDGRVQNITNANTIATYLNHEDEDAVMSLVNPFRYLRADLRHRNPEQVFSVYLTSDRDTKREFHYADFEYPKMDELVFHTDTTHSTPKNMLRIGLETIMVIGLGLQIIQNIT